MSQMSQQILPNKSLQLDYQDFGNLVSQHFQIINDFQTKNGFKFDLIVAKLRNGLLGGSIIANYLNIPMVTISAPRLKESSNYELLCDSETLKQLKEDGGNILFVDSICGTGDTLDKIIKYFKKNFPLVTFNSYCTLVDSRVKAKPSIIGFVSDKFFQPPWEWRSFTPQSHLDRLENQNVKSFDENTYYIGFSSKKCKDSIDNLSKKKITGQWIEIFDLESLDQRINSKSNITTVHFEGSFSIQDLNGKYAEILKRKTDFILNSGFTHFIEDDWACAVRLSENCPVTNILYFDGQTLHKIVAKEVVLSDLLRLNF